MKVVAVLHQFPSAPAGGTERVVLALLTAMRERGHEVAVIAGALEARSSGAIDREAVAGIDVYRIAREDLYFESWEKAWSPLWSAAYAGLLRELQPDVVHVHHWLRLTTDLVRTARDLDVRVVACTLHDHWAVAAKPVRAIGCERALPPPESPWCNEAEVGESFALFRDDLLDEVHAADLCFVPSRAHAQSLAALSAGPLPSLHIATPPLLDVPPRRVSQGVPRGRRLLFFGSVYREKGIDTLLAALGRCPEWSCTIAGPIHDPNERDRIHRAAADLSIAFRDHYTMAELATIEADYAIVPSLTHESYGLVIDEARCLGLPTIAADIPAYREHADPAATAFFVPGDVDVLTALLRDEARLHSLRVPTPHAIAAGAAAEGLLRCYAASAERAFRPLPPAPLVTPARRAAHLFRRAERRLWSALQHSPLQSPPTSFLAYD